MDRSTREAMVFVVAAGVTITTIYRRRAARPTLTSSLVEEVLEGDTLRAVEALAPSARAFRSELADAAAARVLNGTLLGEAARVVTSSGHTVCLSGAFLRALLQVEGSDALSPADARIPATETVFTCPELLLREQAGARGWAARDCGEDGFIELAKTEGGFDKPGTFRGYTRKAVPAPTWTADSLLYVVGDGAQGLLLDPTGAGIGDMATQTLRIPSPSKHRWIAWLVDDKIRGWRLLEYHWLRACGWAASGPDLQHFIVVSLAELIDTEPARWETALRAFTSSVIRSEGDAADTRARAAKLRDAVVAEYDTVRSIIFMMKSQDKASAADSGSSRPAPPPGTRSSIISNGLSGQEWYARNFGELAALVGS